MGNKKLRGPCVVCGNPVYASHVDTKACSPDCAYVYRQKVYHRAGPEIPEGKGPPKKTKPVYRTEKELIEQINRVVGDTRPLVPPIGHTTPRSGQEIRSRTHLIIPDCQVHEGVPTEHLEWVGRYIAEKRPDVIVCIGDFADMPSLSSYDKGKKRFEGRRYVSDIEAARAAMERLTKPFTSLPDYKPRMVLTMGNHEDRITRAIEDAAILEGTIGLHDLAYESFGWEVHPFLEVVEIDGVEYSHYFTSGVMGRPVTSAAALLRERAGSAVMGHVQHTDVAFHKKTQKIAIFAGTCYLHEEEYLTPQGNVQRRQIVMLYEVEDGRFDPLFVSLGYLRRKYGV